MLKYFGTFLLLLFICFPAGSSFAADPPEAAPTRETSIQPAAPVVEAPETSFDFGEVSEDRDYVHDFIIRNTGAAALELKRVLPG